MLLYGQKIFIKGRRYAGTGKVQKWYAESKRLGTPAVRGSTKHRKGLKHPKGATKDLLNTAKYYNGPDNPKPNSNLTLT